MDSLVVPGLDTLRHWLDELGINFFECDNCQALHLPHMQNFDGVFDAKVDLVNDVVLFTAMAVNNTTSLTRSTFASNTPSKFCMCGRCSAWQLSHSKKLMPSSSSQ